MGAECRAGSSVSAYRRRRILGLHPWSQSVQRCVRCARHPVGVVEHDVEVDAVFGRRDLGAHDRVRVLEPVTVVLEQDRGHGRLSGGVLCDGVLADPVRLVLEPE